MLAASYHSDLVAEIKAADFTFQSGRLTVHLAREFGFCYGVDRAVDYAYQARQRFPDQRVYLTGEIIHNPHVNDQIRALGVRFLTDSGESIDVLTPNDVVILPAFGITVELLETLVKSGVVTETVLDEGAFHKRRIELDDPFHTLETLFQPPSIL